MTDTELLEHIEILIRQHFSATPQEPVLEVTTLADLTSAVEQERRPIRLRPGAYEGVFTIRRKGAPEVSVDLTGCEIVGPLGTALAAEPGAGAVAITGGLLCGFAADRQTRYPVVSFGNGEETALEQFPAGISLTDTVIRGNPNGQKRGIAAHVSGLILRNVQILDIKYDGEDSQAMHVNGPGPYTLLGCVLEASAENFLTGGQDPKVQGLVPSDILLDGCTLRKPLEWRDSIWDAKNLLELKTGRRVTIRNTTFDGCWAAMQAGHAVVLKPTNQNGHAPWTCVEDVLFENVTMRNVSSGFKLAPRDSSLPVEGIRRVTIRGGVVQASRALSGGDGHGLMAMNPIEALTVEGVRFEVDGPYPIYIAGGRARSDSVWRQNWLPRNRSGFYAAGFGEGSLALEPGAVFEANTVVGAKASAYPAGTLVA